MRRGQLVQVFIALPLLALAAVFLALQWWIAAACVAVAYLLSSFLARRADQAQLLDEVSAPLEPGEGSCAANASDPDADRA